jgi:hypothetical protein
MSKESSNDLAGLWNRVHDVCGYDIEAVDEGGTEIDNYQTFGCCRVCQITGEMFPVWEGKGKDRALKQQDGAFVTQILQLPGCPPYKPFIHTCGDVLINISSIKPDEDEIIFEWIFFGECPRCNKQGDIYKMLDDDGQAQHKNGHQIMGFEDEVRLLPPPEEGA